MGLAPFLHRGQFLPGRHPFYTVVGFCRVRDLFHAEQKREEFFELTKKNRKKKASSGGIGKGVKGETGLGTVRGRERER